ncbi:hypothetical protein T492DRAFT_844099 [Pavlovales sp. CCMP2436]|nr:hypothetical protein T492DRAFT_844099 [Pavlovales sp. CCMP2436]
MDCAALSLAFTDDNLTVQPIVLNPAVERIQVGMYDGRSLGFAAQPVGAVAQMGTKDLEEALTSVFHAIATPANSSERINGQCGGFRHLYKQVQDLDICDCV